jgi:hypothetical protein
MNRIRLLLTVMMLLACRGLYAGQVGKTLSFRTSDLSFAQDHGYAVPLLAGCRAAGDSGDPQLPQMSASFIVPPASGGLELRTSSESTVLPGEYEVVPVQLPETIGQDQHWTEPNRRLYNSSAAYPEQIAEIVGDGLLAGNRIVTVMVHPLQWVPTEKRLVLHTRITLTLQYAEGGAQQGVTPKRLTPDAKELVEKTLKEMVVNP